MSTRGAATGSVASGDVTTQRRARALGDPTRFAIFRAVVKAAAPQTIADLRAQFELNHTTIRQHLAILVDAGLLQESVAAPSGPGRPRLQYREAPGVAGTWFADGPYERLALLLLEVLGTGRSPHDVGYDRGREAAALLEGIADPLEAVELGVARQGFEPHRVTADGTELVLENCPFASAAAADPTRVCQLHQGLAEGLADGIGGTSVVELQPHEPWHAGCRLRLAAVQSSRPTLHNASRS